MDPEERERRRITAFLEESSDSDENEPYAVYGSDSENEEDHVSIRSQESDTEQEISDSEDDIPLQQLRQSHSSNVIISSAEIAESSDEQVRGSFYDVCRNSRKWPLTIFYAMLNMVGVNAAIIRNSNNEKTRKRRRF